MMIRKNVLIITSTFMMMELLSPLCYAAAPAGDTAQSASADGSSRRAANTIYYDILNRDTPRGTVQGFWAAVKSRDYALAARYLDLQRLPVDEREKHGAILARHLRMVFEQNIRINPMDIDDTYEGRSDDGQPKGQEIVGVIKTDKKVYELLLEKKTNEDGLSIWLWSGQTVATIPEMYSYFGLGVLGHYLPERLFEYEFLGVAAVGWITVVAIAAGSFLIIYVLTQLLYLFVNRLKLVPLQQFTETMLWPVRWVFAAVAANHIYESISFSEAARAMSRARTLVIIALIWFLIRFCEYFLSRWRDALKSSGKGGKALLVALAQKIILIFIVLLGIAFYLENLGFQVTTIVAGLGVGGIAVALASQKSIEDLFGAITLLTSSPVRAGDFVRLEGGHSGTVEEIGIRFTRIRTVERSVLCIPNSKLAGMSIENLSHRDKFLYNPEIGLRLDTTAGQIRYVLLEMRKLVYAHPRIHVVSSRVRLKEFSPYATVLAVFLYIKADDYAESLAVAEDINFRIMAILDKAGVQMAYPTQTIIREQGSPLDPQASENIINGIRQLEKDGKLFLTDLSHEEIRKIHNTIVYPPSAADSTEG